MYYYIYDNDNVCFNAINIKMFCCHISSYLFNFVRLFDLLVALLTLFGSSRTAVSDQEGYLPVATQESWCQVTNGYQQLNDQWLKLQSSGEDIGLTFTNEGSDIPSFEISIKLRISWKDRKQDYIYPSVSYDLWKSFVASPCMDRNRAKTCHGVWR